MDLVKYVILPYLELEDFLILSEGNLSLRDKFIKQYCSKLPNKEEILKKGHLRSVQYYLDKRYIYPNPYLPNLELVIAVKTKHFEIYKLLLDRDFVLSISVYEYMVIQKMDQFLNYLTPETTQKLRAMLKIWGSEIFKE